MIRVTLLGHGLVANHLMVGLERIKLEELKPYGVPFSHLNLKYKIEEISIVSSYEVDKEKIGKSAYEIARKTLPDLPTPSSLKDIYVKKGLHFNSTKGLPIEVSAIDDEYEDFKECIDAIVGAWREDDPDVIVNVISTEHARTFEELDKLKEAVDCGRKDLFSATQAYAYAAAEYSLRYKPVAFVNVIPVLIANDPAYVQLFKEAKAVVFGDDGATGATPITADLLEHLRERNRHVNFIVQFNIGGNFDFYTLNLPERNVMKEITKGCIVKDILGYDVPHFIKPTGYLEPIGDKKFVAIHIEYITFNGLKDEIYVNYRINDSPSLAGILIDLIRLGKLCLDKEYRGTVYPINAFFMKMPGPKGSPSISKIKAYYALLDFLGREVLG